MNPLWLLVFIGFVCHHTSYAIPLEQKNVLPHSREYYAGYIRAITDNFDQLFVNERRVRSTDEGEDEKVQTIY